MKIGANIMMKNNTRMLISIYIPVLLAVVFFIMIL